MKLLKITIAFLALISLQIATAQWLNVPPPVEARGLMMLGGGVTVAAPPSGQTFSDTFTYSDGELESVSSGVWEKLTGTDSSVSSNEINMGDGSAYLYATATDTISQYVAMQTSDSQNTYSGVYARQVAKDNATTKAYALRHNVGEVLVLRYCTGSSCTDIGSSMDPGTIGYSDSIGIEITGTGSSTQWKIWYWDSATPPDRGSWGTCSFGKYISGESATTCTANESVSDLGANYADSGKYIGFYNGGILSGTSLWDNWMGGDIQ